LCGYPGRVQADARCRGGLTAVARVEVHVAAARYAVRHGALVERHRWQIGLANRPFSGAIAVARSTRPDAFGLVTRGDRADRMPDRALWRPVWLADHGYSADREDGTVAAVAKADGEDLPAVFAQLYPQEWRRTAMIPGLRHLITGWLREQDPDPGDRLGRAAIILGHGRALADDQWQVWAQISFALALDDTIKLA
jgi:hypothetical protein